MCACAGAVFNSFAVVADGVDECLKAAREELRQGAHCIKIMGSGGVASPTDPIWMNQYREDEIRAIVNECTERRSYVSAHCHPASAVRRSAEFACAPGALVAHAQQALRAHHLTRRSGLAGRCWRRRRIGQRTGMTRPMVACMMLAPFRFLAIPSFPFSEVTMKMSRMLASVALVCAAVCSAVAAPADLPALGADPQQTSVSGLSSGAFMAVQLQVAYSRTIVGAGVVAGGPYYCAANNPFFTGICMGQVPFFAPNPTLMANFAKDFARAGSIDPLANLSQRRVYVFSGTDDTIVRQSAVDATVSFFTQVGIKPANLKYVNQVPAGHAVITPSFGNDCSANAAPYISHCNVGGEGYDQAGAVLQHIYGVLNPRVAKPTGEIVSFDQRAYAAADTALADTAFVYVPKSCTLAGSRCRVHVALHGCVQSAESVGDQFTTDTGYNEWADSNRILVLYPQVNKSSVPSNPQGCWDWWGYTGGNYAKKSSPQMKAIVAMVNRLTRQP